MIDVQGTSLTSEDIEILQHPYVGGLILFSRNFESAAQVTELVNAIRKASSNEILLAVDHEGGRVQRFRNEFSKIPAMADLWLKAKELTGNDNDAMPLALSYAKDAGYLMASEVQGVGIDISFAPVLDLYGISEVIGDRAFHQNPDKVIALASAFVSGMHLAGMKATGKHFPGHGSVLEDSHIALPIDRRSAEEVFEQDMRVFSTLFKQQCIDAVMPAHVIYPEIDPLAVGFSQHWLQTILRQQLNFDGVIFSDDLTMAGAHSIGNIVDRAEASWQAGCDMLLICNSREESIRAIDGAKLPRRIDSENRIKRLLKGQSTAKAFLANTPEWQKATENLSKVFDI